MDNGDAGGQTWLHQAWADWIRPLGLLIIAALAYGAYHFELVSERVSGVALVLTVVVGLVGAGIFPSLALARSDLARSGLFAVAVCAFVGAGWPTLRIALSPEPLAKATLTTAAPKQTLTTGTDGPYELIVSGRFKQAGADATAGYVLKVEGTGQEEVSGDIKRSTHSYRAGRRGGTMRSVEEHTEVVHRLDAVRGGSITISTDNVDDVLDEGLGVSLRNAGPKPQFFWAIMALAVLIALVLDTKLGAQVRDEDSKTRDGKRPQSYLTIVTGMLLVFSINFPMTATPSSLVRAAIGAFVLCLLLGASSGWLVSAFARLAMRPRRRT